MGQSNLEGLLNVSLEKLKGLVDVDTIIGKPITCKEGVIIIPVSKVTFGYASGGSDVGGNKPKDMFGGGSGGGITIQPVAFLVIKDQDVRLLELNHYGGTADRAVGLVPEMFDKVSDLISKNKKEPSGEQKEQ